MRKACPYYIQHRDVSFWKGEGGCPAHSPNFFKTGIFSRDSHQEKRILNELKQSSIKNHCGTLYKESRLNFFRRYDVIHLSTSSPWIKVLKIVESFFSFRFVGGNRSLHLSILKNCAMHLTKASKCFKMTESVYYFIFLGNQLAKGVLVSNQRRVSRSFSDNSNTRRSRGGEVRGPDTDPDLSPVPLDPPVYLSSIYIQSNTIMS